MFWDRVAGVYDVFVNVINYGSLPYTDFIRTETLCQGGKLAISVSSGTKRMPGTDGNAAGVFKEAVKWGCLRIL